MKQIVIFLAACVVALVLVAPESKAGGRSAEETFDEHGAYIYDNEPANQAYQEAAREMARDEREYEINKIREKLREKRDNAKD